jgi:hypothetical protein
MSNLDTVLALAKFQTTFKQQREVLVAEFQDACIVAYNGGLFDVTPEFLAGLELRLRHTDSKELWVIDRNQASVRIADVEQFIAESINTYNQAAQTYGEAWYKLRTRRNVKSIIEK